VLNKRGLSGVVTVVILIALSVALVAVVWGVVQSMIEGNLDSAESCSTLFTEKVVEINNDYTCQDGDSLYFAITVGDVDLDSILVRIEGLQSSKTFKLEESSSFSNLKTYADESAKMPSKNSGLTYKLNIVSEGLVGPFKIGVSPVIKETVCDEIDRINSVDSCQLIPSFPQ